MLASWLPGVAVEAGVDIVATWRTCTAHKLPGELALLLVVKSSGDAAGALFIQRTQQISIKTSLLYERIFLPCRFKHFLLQIAGIV